MDNQRQQHYLPGPPPPPGGQGNMSYLPPPPPRSQMGMPPPPPGPHPSAYPPGTVFGLPAGWNQSYGRPGMGHLPPPPPMSMNQNQHQQYNMTFNNVSRGQGNPPPPPPRQEDLPLVSATFIPGGDSWGPGVGIQPLNDFSTFSGYDGNYDPAAYAEQSIQSNNSMYNGGNSAYSSKPTSAGPDPATRENRAGSATSNRPKFPQLRENPEPMSPGPPTATLINPNPGRPRAQSAMVPQNANLDLANQWPLDRVLLWLAATGFSHEWQETFRTLRLEKGDFLELGRSTDKRSNLSRMHQYIYPQLGKICQQSGLDAKKEREDGKRLQRLIAGILQGTDAATSAGTGHRRRESGLTSAGTEGNVENSPHLGGNVTPNTTGPEGSPARSHFGQGLSQRNAQERSITLPVFPKSGSNGSTPAERQHAESFGPPVHRGEYTRGVLNGIGNRGRHSPNLSGDAAAGGLSLRQENSPGQSPALGHALPTQAQSTPHLPLREPPGKAQSADSFQKATGFLRNNGAGNIVHTEVPLGAGRFYETQKDRTEARPEVNRAYSNDIQTRDQGKKSFLSQVFQRRRHDPNDPTIEENSPTSPRDFLQKLPFPKSQANHSDTALAQKSPANMFLSSEDTSQKKVPKRFILLTPDYWNYRLVDVTDAESAFALKNKIGMELGIADMDYAQIYVTEPGKMDHDEPLTDASLAAARGTADSAASLKLFVRSPTLSAVSMPQTDGLGILGSQTRQDAFSRQAPPLSDNELRKAAEEYRHENEKKRMAYLQNRQERRGHTSETGTPVYDFDHPSPKGFPEDGKGEQLVPHRKPPAAPSASHTLAKVNSLRTISQHKSRSSLDSNKRLSDPLGEEPSPRQKSRFDPSGGIGAAIANSSKIAVLPAAAGGQRSSRTVTIGSKDGPKPRMPISHDTAESSPQLGPATESMPRSDLGRKRSYGPDYEFKETNVAFAATPNPQTASKDDSDSDSDDGLFAIKIRPNKAETPKKTDQRPALTVDTDQPPGGTRKSVAFKTPNSNDGVSAGAANTGDESANTGTSDGYNQRSFSGGSGSWEERSPEESRVRPNSFYSDIWASRPVVENIVEDLDKFFPGVDLDAQIMEEGGEGSPMQGNQTPKGDLKARLGNNITFGTTGLDLDFKRKNDSDTLGSDESTLKANQKNRIANVASRQMSKAGGLSRMKSIREVAQKHNDIQRAPSLAYRAQQAYQPQTSMPMRRKSTKMFGANIVQIKPQRGSRLSVLDPIPQEDVPTEETPKRQATFKIIRGQLIGKGTYGRVYLGMNATTGEFLAVKQVEVNHKAAAHDKDRIAEMVKALDIEIDTMQHLEHPNIVQYLGFERKEYSMSIYLEYISGGSVGSCLRKHGKFEEPVVKSMTIQTLEGLKYLHDESILHRDLKADNLLLDLDGTCKISDFGISKKSEDIYRNDITNSMQGSVFWMAPEVVRTDGMGYSAKVDIWSLGCVVLEMFAGKRPWSREEAIGAIFKLGSLQQAPPIPDDVQATASIDGLAFMYDCFQVDPLERPTAKTLLGLSNFCISDPNYNFFDTKLAAKLRNANLMPQT